jgi:glycosyltransferase involved in cell wall biosynthesis
LSAAQKGAAAALTTIVVWTSFIIISRASAAHTLQPFDLALLRYLGAGVVLLPWGLWLVARQRSEPGMASSFGGFSPLPFGLSLGLGLTGGVLFGWFSFSAFFLAPAGHASVFLTGSLPLWSTLVAWVWLHEQIGARRALGLPASGRVLVQVGALSERKGPLPLVRAFLGLPSGTRGEATLALVGTGPLEAELNALSAVSAGAVRLFGHRDPAGVREILHAADTFVLNTFLDPNPLSPIEAGACGLPLVLSARAGNVAELIGASGLGIAIADPADPTEALRVALGWSDAELATLGRKARAATESAFSVIAVAADLVRRTR